MFGIDDAILIPAAASFVGGLFRNKSQADQAESAQQFSADQYAHRYQTQVADMQAAGLNPMLSYGQSPGASPQGQQAQMQDVVSPAVASAQQGKLLSAQIENLKAQTDNTRMSTLMDGQVKHGTAELLDAQRIAALASANVADSQVPLNAQNIRESISRVVSNQVGNKLTEEQTKRVVDEILLLQQQQRTEGARVRNLNADTTLKGLSVNEAQASSNFFGGALGEASPTAKFIMNILQGVRSLGR